MRTYASLVVCLLMWVFQETSLGGNNSDLFFVRRAFICELGIPPSISELEWLLTYQTNALTSGVQHVLDIKYGKESSAYKTSLFNFYINSNNKEPVMMLNEHQQDLILKYQTGKLDCSKEDAKKLLAECALSCIENSEDPIDYLFASLCGRYTNTQEYGMYNKIFLNNLGSDLDKLISVINAILDSSYFITY